MDATNSRIIRLPEVQRKTGLGRSSIYKHMALGNFPQSLPMGMRAVGWLERDIDNWIAERVQAARAVTA
ncbi:transcriptional regulator [Bordetella hinzii]|uniref:helix-turn-helix transcriptional regulator n=1 Tax=Bordetella hinzii TaxID=103855 RepID=UPI000421FCA2|nr:AlpA family transcriptional regulator [Bordetella hinzii]AKQ56399.1 Prophage CP4-57 regulatory protein (AlpA) [Bordetella hinzii]KCB28606.1 transcriptional regulator, AlpA family [Bordetella hinzii L60]SNV74846.1 transcriptional regulator [Bordetella hinzii]